MAAEIEVMAPVPQRRVSMRSVAWLQSLRGRLILILFAVGVLPLAIVGALSASRQKAAYIDLSGRALSETAYHVGSVLDRNFFERHGDIQVQARGAVLQAMDPATLGSHLDTVVQLYRPTYSLMLVADAAGKVIATSSIDGAGRAVPSERVKGTDVSSYDWFRAAVGGQMKAPLVEDLHDDPILRSLYGENARSWAMTFTMPIERNGAIVGVVRSFCDWQAVQEILSGAMLRAREAGNADANVYLINKDGKAIFSPDTAEFMKSFAGHPLVAAAQKSNGADSIEGPGLGSDQTMLAGFYRTRGYSDYPGSGWIVLLTEPVAVAEAAANALLRNTIVIALLVALVIVFVSVFLAGYLTRPLGMMAGHLHNLAGAEADLSQRLPSHRSDEIGIVSRSFNTFVDNLQRLIGQVIRAGMQVTMSSTQIAAGSRQLEATVSEQVAATNEVVATTNEIAATAKDLAGTMSAVARMSEETASAASNGQRDLQLMAESVTRMEEATQAVSARLGVINDKAGNIATVVTTITKVADQTNLLSLNAAIEAEKAGQFGQGFAVVAREIRRLADQTAVATLDIEKMVKEMKAAVSSGVMSMEKLNEQVAHSVDTVRQVGMQLEAIIGKVQEVTPRFESAHLGMQAQMQGAQQISQAMGQLSESTQQTAIALQDSNRAIRELNDAASSLQTMFSRFKLTAA
jgi:methyl-accepting chemotaxis protein